MTVWTIAQLERNTADGGVVVAHWRATATETRRYVLSKLFIRHCRFHT
jgi:hypothetical protein